MALSLACLELSCCVSEVCGNCWGTLQVIKMPHSQKQSEDKEKMAFMEYAISGILLHNNVVQVRYDRFLLRPSLRFSSPSVCMCCSELCFLI